MPKATKKTVKKITKKVLPKVEPVMVMSPSPVLPTVNKPMNTKILGLALIVVVIALLSYKGSRWAIPVIVNNRPIFRFELWSRLEKAYGTQALDDMVNEKILDKAIADAHIKIDQTKLDAQVKSLETQFESTGGLDEALKQRGLSRADLIKQIKTQLSVEELLADKITPSEEEIQKQFDSGATTVYKGKTLDDVKVTIIDELKQTKLRDAFLVWFAEIKKNAKVQTFGL
jgi:hypothetical protein